MQRFHHHNTSINVLEAIIFAPNVTTASTREATEDHPLTPVKLSFFEGISVASPIVTESLYQSLTSGLVSGDPAGERALPDGANAQQQQQNSHTAAMVNGVAPLFDPLKATASPTTAKASVVGNASSTSSSYPSTAQNTTTSTSSSIAPAPSSTANFSPHATATAPPIYRTICRSEAAGPMPCVPHSVQWLPLVLDDHQHIVALEGDPN